MYIFGGHYIRKIFILQPNRILRRINKTGTRAENMQNHFDHVAQFQHVHLRKPTAFHLKICQYIHYIHVKQCEVHITRHLDSSSVVFNLFSRNFLHFFQDFQQYTTATMD